MDRIKSFNENWKDIFNPKKAYITKAKIEVVVKYQ
jgi:hypothetical protein